jgi:hypothetical protein
MIKPLLNKECALAAISVFFESTFRNLHQKDAVLYIVECTSPSDQEVVATETVTLCLDFLEKHPRASFWSSDRLVVALLISEQVRLPKHVAERLVNTAAQRGFHGRFPELPERLLGRHMNEGDVIALISAYVEKGSSRCTSDEEKFVMWAKRYLSPEKAQIQIERIQQFVKAWEFGVSL